MVLLAAFAEHHGLGTLQAASLIGIVGVASAAGRLTLGVMASHWSALALYRACFLGLGVSLVVWLLCHGRYEHLVGFALLLGAAQGAAPAPEGAGQAGTGTVQAAPLSVIRSSHGGR
jgi:hypothetical protein